MRVAVRHGIYGNEELTTQVVAGVTVGWDLMQQIALRLALDSPFQIVLYLSSTAGILSPVRTISSQMAPLDLERYAIWCKNCNTQPPSTTKR